MSQFILILIEKGKKRNKDFNFDSILDLKNNSAFIQKCSSILIKNIEMKYVYTISNFDEICVLAQEALSNNVELKHTQLWNILNELKKEEIYFWYGNELEDLDKINNFNDLVAEIKNSLNDFSGEFYIHYKPNSPQLPQLSEVPAR